MKQTETSVNHFGVLVDYLAEYPDDQIEQLAETYEAPEATPSAVARQWCQHPEAYLETLDETFRSETAWSALAELAYDHDSPVETDWMAMSARHQLVEVGFLNERVTSAFYEEDVVVPGALAALVAPRLEDTRPSLAVLLGKEDDERVRNLAREYDLSDSGSKVEVVLRLMDFMSEPGTIEDLLTRVANPDWLGVAMMILELGGICYWQEVFGYEIDGDGDEDEGTVVPLMRQEERSAEKQISETLLRLGVVYRFQPPDTDHPMVAVPEMLWGPLWNLGRSWLVEWIRRSLTALRDGGKGGSVPSTDRDLQYVGKWLVCESATGEVTLEGDELDEDSLERLAETADADPDEVRSHIANLVDLSVLRRGLDGFMTLGAEYEKLLNMSRPEFVRNVLYEWCGGFLGRRFERHLPKAIGLDEEWREQATEVLRARHEFIPHWMSFEGVEQERTGAGCLRETMDSSPEMLADELGLANGYVWSTKMIWLDALSFLDGERWYDVNEMVGLMQYVSSVCLFSQIGRLLEDPRAYFYLPVQRTSFLTDPFHTSEFEAWVEAVVEELLVPLGVAATREVDDAVWLKTDNLRIETPPGWADAERRALLAEITGSPLDEGVFPPAQNVSLHTVSEPIDTSSGQISLDQPVDEVLEATRDKSITEFTGDALVLAS